MLTQSSKHRGMKARLRRFYSKTKVFSFLLSQWKIPPRYLRISLTQSLTSCCSFSSYVIVSVFRLQAFKHIQEGSLMFKLEVGSSKFFPPHPQIRIHYNISFKDHKNIYNQGANTGHFSYRAYAAPKVQLPMYGIAVCGLGMEGSSNMNFPHVEQHSGERIQKGAGLLLERTFPPPPAYSLIFFNGQD